MNKDLFLRIFFIVIWISILSYTIFLYYNWISFSTEQNKLWVLSFNILCSFILIILWIFQLSYNHPRLYQILFWILIILFSKYYIIDNPIENVYLWDILKLFWVIIFIWWTINFFEFNKTKKEKLDKKIEIIEV